MKWTGVALAACVLLACGKNIDTREAVQASIVKDVGKRVDVNNMDVNVTSVSFRGNEADAVVLFAAKGGGPGSGFSMRYSLEKRGGEWAIKARSQADASKHAGGVQEIPGEGGEMRTPGGQLPPGHPPVPSGTKP